MDNLIITPFLMIFVGLYICFIKKNLPFFVFIISIIFLYLVQSFYINLDLSKGLSPDFLNAVITYDGFEYALYYVNVTILLITLSTFFGNKFNNKIIIVNDFINLNSKNYLLIIFINLIITYYLVFNVVGLSNFLEQSRPGLESGTTILLSFLILGFVPINLKYLCAIRPNLLDIACVSLSAIVFALFSRIHLLVYGLSVLICYYYGSGLNNKTQYKLIIRIIFYVGILLGIFIIIGAVRDSLSYTTIENSIEYIINNQDNSLVSFERNYRIGIEGMSGLSSSISRYLNGEKINWGYGIDVMIFGIFQSIPGFMKDNFITFFEIFNDIKTNSESIVSSGIENSFTSFFILGPFVFAIIFFFLSDILLNKIFDNNGIFYKLYIVNLISNTLFFIRGSWYHWVAYVISTSFFMLFFYIFFKQCIIKNNKII